MPSAIVTGASQGIGLAIALRLADDGCDIILNDISSQAMSLEKAKSAIIDRGRESVYVIGDVSIEADVQSLVDSAVSHFGELNIMVANAGIQLMKGLKDTTAEEFARVMNVNTLGVFLCYQKAGAQMISQGKGGKIVGACSISGYRPQPTALAYGASKWAVRGLTQATAQDLAAHGINVNAYCPGMVRTQMWEDIDESFAQKLGIAKGVAWDTAIKERSAMKKGQTPEDIAGCVSFLCSKDSDMITGQSIIVDGGIVFS